MMRNVLFFAFFCVGIAVCAVCDFEGEKGFVAEIDKVLTHPLDRNVVVQLVKCDGAVASVRWDVDGLVRDNGWEPLWKTFGRYLQWGVDANGKPLKTGFVRHDLAMTFKQLAVCLQEEERISYDGCDGWRLTFAHVEDMRLGRSRLWHAVEQSEERKNTPETLRVIIPGLRVMLEGVPLPDQGDTRVASEYSLWMHKSYPAWSK